MFCYEYKISERFWLFVICMSNMSETFTVISNIVIRKMNTQAVALYIKYFQTTASVQTWTDIEDVY